MSRIPSLRTQTKRTVAPNPNPSVTGTKTSIVSKRDTSARGKQLVVVGASEESIARTSRLQKRVFREALKQMVLRDGEKVKAVGAEMHSGIRPPTTMTKRGVEPVVQQMTMQTTIQRTPRGEYIGKSLVGVNVDPSGRASQVEITSQQIDPRYATESAGVNETISTTSSLSVTSKGKQLKKSFKKSTVIADKFRSKPNLNSAHLNRLVREETEDVENTLKMVPPDVASSSVEKYPLKRKVQTLRLNAEPMSLLNQSVTHPTPTADEVDSEAPPEILAQVMDAVEKGATPESAPTQVFNSLFPDIEEQRMDVSSVAPGLLEDVVVPTSRPGRLVDQVLTQEMEDFLVNEIQKKEQVPKDGICIEKSIAVAPFSPVQLKDPLNMETEPAPWEDATVQKLSDLVGAYPMNLLESSDFSTLETATDINKELANGIDYFLDADVVPYENKIQIRGSKPPNWFPGYMSAFPHLPELVKLSKKPSEVLHTAWKAVQPKIFPDDSLLIA